MLRYVDWYKPIAWLAFALLLLPAFAATAKESRYYGENGVAIHGYDPVAYFVDAKARKGKSTFSYNWMDAEWHFVSEKNRQAFIDNPESYAPQYNGYCAFAASRNYIYKTDPNAWTVHNNKLYLNAGLTVRVRWALDKDANISKGDKNWPGLRQQLQ